MNSLPLIENNPAVWKDLQDMAGRILSECGYDTETDKTIETARGPVNVDVYVSDTKGRPEITFLVECKHWASAVPKTIVHAFRTVVSDFGANVGYIISSQGFQTGALTAARNSPLRLVTWEDFQSDFYDQWIENYFIPKIAEAAGPLEEYTEPINSRIIKKANNLSKERQCEFKLLRNKYLGLASVVLPYSVTIPVFDRPPLELPLRKKEGSFNQTAEFWIPDDLLDASTLRGFLDAFCRNASLAISEFDRIFGERA
ncbi:MAG: restriction endonuclease [Thermodesulfobacteriota bacterium]